MNTRLVFFALLLFVFVSCNPYASNDKLVDTKVPTPTPRETSLPANIPEGDQQPKVKKKTLEPIYTQVPAYGTILGLPIDPDQTDGIGSCFADDAYLYGMHEYIIHPGTDFMTSGVVMAACDGKIIDVYKQELLVSEECRQNIEESALNRPFLHGYSYQRQHPVEEELLEYAGPDGRVYRDTGNYDYGNVVVIECDERIDGKIIQTLYFHLDCSPNLLTLRDKVGSTYPARIDSSGNYSQACIGDKITMGTIFGYAGNTGTAVFGRKRNTHLHFEVRFGSPSENGIIPRKYSVNPAWLELEYKILSEDFVEMLEIGSISGQEPASCFSNLFTIPYR